MSIDNTASSGEVTADSGILTADASRPFPAGWPCATLPTVPPSVLDRQSGPTADDLLPQILALTPRGPAWGTDEAGDGRGASPMMRGFWRAIAGWAADQNVREFDLATQALPSAITWSLPDWEREFGLPDACSVGTGGPDTRVAAVRGRFGALGGSSPAYFVCLAASIGYDVTIEEPTQFLVDVSELSAQSIAETWFVPDGSEIGVDGDLIEGFTLAAADDGDEVAGGLVETWFVPDGSVLGAEGDPLEGFGDAPGGTVWKTWIVHVGSVGETWFVPSDSAVVEGWFVPDSSEIGPDGDLLESFKLLPGTGEGSEVGANGDPLEGFLPATDLECLFRRLAPTHTELIFDYAALA